MFVKHFLNRFQKKSYFLEKEKTEAQIISTSDIQHFCVGVVCVEGCIIFTLTS